LLYQLGCVLTAGTLLVSGGSFVYAESLEQCISRNRLLKADRATATVLENVGCKTDGTTLVESPERLWLRKNCEEKICWTVPEGRRVVDAKVIPTRQLGAAHNAWGPLYEPSFPRAERVCIRFFARSPFVEGAIGESRVDLRVSTSKRFTPPELLALTQQCLAEGAD
jgi:hypothetical protein